MADCKTCARFNKRFNYCEVLITKPKNCWAWTADPYWHIKVRKDIVAYKKRSASKR